MCDNVIQDEIDKLQSHKGLKISHLNCLSLMKHFDEVKSLVTETDIDITTLSETHLCTNIDDSEIRIPGYTLIRRDRNRSGGGVAMYIRNNLIFVQRDELCSDTKLEILVAEIKLEKQKPFFVICWYRPPNSKIEVFNDFERVMQRIDDSRVPYYVLGDMNCDVINKSISWHTKKLLDIIELFNCTQLIDRYILV